MIYILAGRMQQAEDYARFKGLRRNEWRYLDRPERLHGLRGAKVVRVGTWQERNDARDIDYMLAARQCEVSDDPSW